MDGNNWTTIRQHTADDTLSATSRHAFFAITSSATHGSPDPTMQFYKRFRIYITGPSHSGETNFGISFFPSCSVNHAPILC
jgi:hypothetical protein